MSPAPTAGQLEVAREIAVSLGFGEQSVEAYTNEIVVERIASILAQHAAPTEHRPTLQEVRDCLEQWRADFGYGTAIRETVADRIAALYAAQHEPGEAELRRRCKDLITAWNRVAADKSTPRDWAAGNVTAAWQLEQVLKDTAPKGPTP